jgi:uncharacterized protein (DUF1919 family)
LKEKKVFTKKVFSKKVGKFAPLIIAPKTKQSISQLTDSWKKRQIENRINNRVVLVKL